MTAFLDETMSGDGNEYWAPELDDSMPSDGHDIAADEERAE